MLTREDLIAVEAIFDEVVELDEPARVQLLHTRCALRPDLRAEIETLLSAHERVAGFMEPIDSLTVPNAATAAEPRLGRTVGAWRLLRRIGGGGMGEVYLAERADGAYAGQAAVKFTRTQLPDPVAARRFSLERQFLASLHHPNIVTLLDGGATPEGEAYLVMEYVEGTPITEFCRARVLSLEARLSLMRQVCGAVQYAHQRAIVHRDLKPGNILVTADGAPKILDFGVAKLLEGADDSITTTVLPGPLTPNYASPEQLRGLGVTTAADVYSLGVLLYEVATGERPYETAGQTLDAVMKIVVDTEPSRPSAPRTGGGDTTLPYPRQRLRGDLDAIVLKAMRKEPEARYGSAGELADDLGRFLSGEPVVAREPSLSYALRRLALRNKALVGVTAAALVAIVTALGIALWQRQTAVREQARAEARFREVRQLANALIFKIHDRVATLAGSTPVRREIVDEALTYLERLERDAVGDPVLQLELAAAYRQIGNILGTPGLPNLGDREGAIREFQRSRRLLLPLASQPTATPEALASIVDTDRRLAGALIGIGREDEAAAIAQEAVGYAERALAASHPDGKELLGRALFQVAMAEEADDVSERHWRRAEALYAELLAEKPDDPSRQRNLGLVDKYLGARLQAQGKQDEAKAHYARALELDERRLAKAPDDRTAQFDTGISLANMASIADERGDAAAAYDLFTRSLKLRMALSASDPEDVLARGRVAWVQNRLARLEKERGNLSAAVAQATASVDNHERVVGRTGDTRSNAELGRALITLGEVELARGRASSGCAALARATQLFETKRADQRSELLKWSRELLAANCGRKVGVQQGSR